MAERFHCLVEIPKGSRNTYEWDFGLGAIGRDRRFRHDSADGDGKGRHDDEE